MAVRCQFPGRLRPIHFHRRRSVRRDLGDGIVREHRCAETLCVKVADGHLKSGTQAANLAHAVALGRHIGPTPAGGDPRGRYGRLWRSVMHLMTVTTNDE